MTLTTLTLSQSILQALADSALSESSKIQHTRHLEKLSERHGDVWSAIVDYEASIAILSQKYAGKHASLVAYSGAVLSCFKHMPDLENKAPMALKAWKCLSNEAKQPTLDRLLSSQPSEKQALGWVPFREIVRKRDALPVGSVARLLIGVYSYIAPRRNDFSAIRLYPTQPPEGTTGNFIVLSSCSALTMQVYKTSAVYGRVTETLPPELVAEIHANLARRSPESRDYLFVSTKTKLPYKSDASFGSWANALFLRVFRRPVTFNTFRHSFISALDIDNMTLAERMDVALKMGHSIETQTNYRWLIRD